MIDTQSAVTRCEELVALARARGADAADAACRAGASESVTVRLGELEEVDRSESEQISLRVFVGKRAASIQTSDFAPEGLAVLADRAVEMARLAPEDPYGGLAPQECLFAGSAPDLELFDPDEPRPEELRSAALAAEEAARRVPGVTNSEGGSASASRAVFGLATSNGFARGYASGSHSLSASVVAGEGGGGMETDYAYATKRFRGDLPDPAEIGREAGERAVRKVGPGSVPSRRMPVVFDPRVGNGVIGHLLSAMAAPAVARKASFLIGREEEALFDSAIRLREEPLRRRGLRSRYFDGEGVPCADRMLVENGRITGWLANVASASQLGLSLTGHASRGGGAPGVAASNVVMEAGSVTPEELMRDIDEGLYVTGLFGQGVNLVTGDYSRGASGFRIRNGEIAGPVSEITIAGTLPEMFRALTPASDLEFRYGVDVPTFRIENMSVAGE